MKRHLVYTAGLITFLALCVALVNFRVDPLLLYYHRHGGEEVLSRVEQFPNMRLYKPYHVARIKPHTVIIGTSRSGTIRPPKHGEVDGSAYNLSMPGLTMHEMFGMVRHAHAQEPLRRLIIGLDYLALVSTTPLSRPGYEESRLSGASNRTHSIALLLRRIGDTRETLLSFDMLRQSLRAIRRPDNLPRLYFADGSWRQLGMRLSGNAGYIYNARFGLNLSNLEHFRTRENILILEQLLDFCYRNNIETTLFFTPVHTFFVDIWHRLGKESLWREAHSEVLRANRQAARRSGRKPFEVLGFQTEAEVVAEPIYPTGKASDSWLSDGLHFGDKLAVKIIESVLLSPRMFGESLDERSLNPYLERTDVIRRDFLRANQKQVTALYDKIEFVRSAESMQ
jgi:hypothetical protein